MVNTGLITSTVITGGISVAAFASGVGLPVGIALSGTSSRGARGWGCILTVLGAIYDLYQS